MDDPCCCEVPTTLTATIGPADGLCGPFGDAPPLTVDLDGVRLGEFRWDEASNEWVFFNERPLSPAVWDAIKAMLSNLTAPSP